MSDWISTITNWFVGLVKAAFSALVKWIHDAALWVFDGLLSALASVAAAIPVPSFLNTGINIADAFAVFPPFSLYILGQLNLPAVMGVLSAGVVFRLARKASTLGQW